MTDYEKIIKLNNLSNLIILSDTNLEVKYCKYYLYVDRWKNDLKRYLSLSFLNLSLLEQYKHIILAKY